MRLRRPRAFELLVALTAIGGLTGVALERALPLFVRAEQVAFSSVRAELDSALRLETAERVLSGAPGELAALDRVNPMDLLVQPPRNYVGVRAPDAPAPSRSWHFERECRCLVYVPSRLARAGGDRPVNARLELAVEIVFDDRDGDGRFTPGDRFDGVRLTAPRGDWIG